MSDSDLQQQEQAAIPDVVFVPADMLEGGLLGLTPREDPDELLRR